nr:hypothetical protein [Aurantimonas marina]
MLGGDRLHAAILSQAGQENPANAAIAGCGNQPAEKAIPMTVALEFRLDRERAFGFIARPGQKPQFRDTAQLATDEQALHQRVRTECQLGIAFQERVVDGITEAQAPGFTGKPLEMKKEEISFMGVQPAHVNRGYHPRHWLMANDISSVGNIGGNEIRDVGHGS